MARGKGWANVAAAIVAATAAAAAGGDPADAASRFCRQLEARLAEPLGSARFRQYDRAVEEQRQELLQAERHAGRAGCFDDFFTNPLCPGLLGTLERMDRNLAMLERRLDQLARRDDARGERARILAALEANRCNEEQEEIRILPPPIDVREPEENRNVLTGPFDGGTFRTLCVRTCDGYYFPISFSVTPDQFDRDQKKCEAMCPGTEVRLYSHRMPGEESKDMVSGAGTPYTELPNAFKYRQAGYVRPEGCGCSPSKNFSIIAGEPRKEEAGTEADAQAAVPLPKLRTDPDAGGTLTAGGATETAPRENAAPKPPATTPAEEKRGIRVVGPRFLPDPEGAIDLRAPGRTEVR